MKYTINRTTEIQGRNLKLGRYVRLADIGEEWQVNNKYEKKQFFNIEKTITCKYTSDEGTHLRRVKVKEHTNHMVMVYYDRYRIAKNDTHEFVVRIREIVKGPSWEQGTQYVSIYAMRPRERKRAKEKKETVIQAAVLTAQQWAEFLK